MNKRHLLWASFAATAIAVAACGGGSDDNTPAPSPSPTPSPAPAPSPSQPSGATPFNVTGDRIEPLDTLKSGEALKAVTPTAFSQLPAGASVPLVALGPVAQDKTDAAEVKGQAFKIGQRRDVPATAKSADVAGLWQWNTLADGSQVAAVRFASEGAKALRLGLLVDSLPEGAVLRFYGAGEGAQVTEMTAAEVLNLRQINEEAGVPAEQARQVWGGVTEGAQTTLELQLPAGASPADVQLSVPALSHLTRTVMQAIQDEAKDTDDIGRSGGCNLNVRCDDSLSAESRAVAKMVYEKGDGTYLCTGTLLNDAKGSRTPYFLSAAHCLSDQTSASSLVTFWFFRATACSGRTMDSAAGYLASGARLHYVSTRYDTILMQLNSPAPQGAVFAGSYFGGGLSNNMELLGVHHPRGDLQKYSRGRITGYGTCTIGGTSCARGQNASNGTMLEATWYSGTTEGGSSGSALFTQDATTGTRYVVGALHGGNASCINTRGQDFYGRFEKSFADGINKWLK